MKWISRFLKDESGAVMVIVALALVVLLGCAALVVDAGVIYSNKSNLQNIADAAALAGAQDLPSATTATVSARNYAQLNGVPTASTAVNTPYGGDSSKIEVICTRSVPYIFAQVFGFTNAPVSARAVAQQDYQWNGEALPFVNMGEQFHDEGDLIDVWGPKANIAPGNKERIHDDVVNVPSDYCIIINIKDDNDGKGPYMYMKGGVAVSSEISTPLTNIVQEGKTVYVFSLKNNLIEEDYADNVIKNDINKYHLPMNDLVLLKCTVVSDWSKSEKTVYLKYQEAYDWDAVKKTFLMTDGKLALIE